MERQKNMAAPFHVLGLKTQNFLTYLSYIDEVEVPVLVNNGKLALIGQTGLVQRHLYHLKKDFQAFFLSLRPNS